jgi:hypothetical protein
MKNLSKFLPAETLLILEDNNANLKDLLKLTFMDLLVRQVLQIIKVERQSHPRDRVRIYTYVTRGKNFICHLPREHEKVFLSPFQQSSSIQVMFHQVIRMGFQNAGGESKYISILGKSPAMIPLFTKTIFQLMFWGFSISAEGLAMRNKLSEELAQLEKVLPDIISNDRDKALQLIKAIGGNIFLVKNIDFAILDLIDAGIMAEMNRKEKTKDDDDGTTWIGCGGCSTWETSDSGSGCSGSGCGGSGCSGCGGCGGCGS